ncbi:probable myosin-binding protein 6 [Durio zibethinus]|uniref:Probable myosin-binding protein 6 n=1 Tax=Durio zibethinus TaxID=66656 RepID=A0A6P5XJE7_DURZI|nr:probable myosin-binding protein 6 [Durio zibethinus]XP_022728515.1 probable myosin-binding protein 6 [Durio zibethinus]
MKHVLVHLQVLRLQTMLDKKSGYDAKGKKIIDQKQKSGIQRRKRSAFGYGKSSPVLVSGNFPSAVAGVSCSSYFNGGETRSEISEFSNGEEKGSSFIRKFTCNTNEKLGITGDEAIQINMLEQALEEEKATLAALYLELEKESPAAASAADGAMAMILRLQEDNASIEMEARQYQRMIGEKFAYDEEEMIILREILVRREKENHLLEKEVEAYRQMNNLGDEQKCWPSKNETSSEWKKSHTAAVNLAGKREGQDDDAIVCQAIATKTAQNFTAFEKTSLCAEGLERNAEIRKPLGSNQHDSTLDTEPAICDVHVVDDKIDIPKEENRKETTCQLFLLQITKPCYMTWGIVLLQSVMRGWRLTLKLNTLETGYE